VARIDPIRQEWADGYRRFESERESPPHYNALHAQLDAFTVELRRRVGSVFTLAELVAEYGRAELWARQVVLELPRPDRWPSGIAIAVDTAFHLYSRGAKDYAP
jgi:hypothetical protein